MGVTVRMNSSAEWEFRHFTFKRPIVCNTHRHDIVQALVSPLRRLEKEHQELARKKRDERTMKSLQELKELNNRPVEVPMPYEAPTAPAPNVGMKMKKTRIRRTDEQILKDLEQELAAMKVQVHQPKRIVAEQATPVSAAFMKSIADSVYNLDQRVKKLEELVTGISYKLNKEK